MKSRTTIILTAVLGIIVIVGFAIAFTTLSNTQSALANAKSQLSNTQAQLSSTQSLLSTTHDKLSNTQTELSSTQSQLTNFQTQLKTSQDKLLAVQVQLATLQTSISKPAPQVVKFTSLMQGTGFLGLGSQELIVTATIINRGGPGKVTITAKLTGNQASQSGNVSVFLDQSEQQDVTVIIPNAPTNETLSVTAQ